MIEYLPSFNKDSGFDLQVWGHRRQKQKDSKESKNKNKKPYNLTVYLQKIKGSTFWHKGRGSTKSPLAQELTADGFWMRKNCYFCLFV